MVFQIVYFTTKLTRYITRERKSPISQYNITGCISFLYLGDSLQDIRKSLFILYIPKKHRCEIQPFAVQSKTDSLKAIHT